MTSYTECILALQQGCIGDDAACTSDTLIRHAYRKVCTIWVSQQLHCSRDMVVLQGRLVIVNEGQGVGGLDQEIIVETAMLVVMRGSRPAGAEQLQLAHSPGLQWPTMAQ